MVFASNFQKRLMLAIQEDDSADPSAPPPVDTEAWLLEARDLRDFLHTRGEEQNPDDTIEEWEAQLAPLGEEWLAILDEGIASLEAAEQQGLTFHLQAELYYLLILQCHQLDLALEGAAGPWQDLIESGLYCLRNAKSLCLQLETEQGH